MNRPEYIESPGLAGLTTLGLGGPARRLARVGNETALLAALEDNGHRPVCVLGSGSNLVVADRGFDGLLLQSQDHSCDYDPATGDLTVGAGLSWDDLVTFAVQQGAAGIECLAGIPGLCGAAPVQNIGAYGQEIGQVLTSVRAVHLGSGAAKEFSHAECGFAYRRSRFKYEDSATWMITQVRLRLRPNGPATLLYRELAAALEAESDPDLARVRAEVLRLRRSKSMVYDREDPNHRSAGSFFTNPIVSAEQAAQLAAATGSAPPAWPTEDGRVKLAAAWLIQRSGFEKGAVSGSVGLSTNHVLALINRGGAKTSELLAFATGIRDRVRERFGIDLRPEPVPLGFLPEEIADLWGDQPAR